MKILICDDEPSRAEEAKKKIGYRADVEMLAGENLRDELSQFFDSIPSFFDGNMEKNCKFNGYDILVFDNNLTGLKLKGARLTAETIIGYLRAFTDVPYIISLNKNPHVDFDLRYLFGDYQSLADLALNTRHLSSERLWDGKSEGKFSPWYWPGIKDAAHRRRNQIDFVAKNLEMSIWEALEFPSLEYEYLSLRARSRFPSDIDIREASFVDFIKSSHILPPAEIEELSKLAEEGNELARSAIYRISAYEVDRWIRRDVLATQDVLIDLPHLIIQMPFLLGDNANNIDCWNAALKYEEPPFGLNEKFYKRYLVSARFSHDIWVPSQFLSVNSQPFDFLE